MNKGILVVLILITQISFAQVSTNDCTKTFLNINNWSDLPLNVISCLDSSDKFFEAINSLCLEDRESLSPEYQQYLKYKKEYEDTLAWYESLPQRAQRSASVYYKLRLARENWETLGMKNTIRVLQSQLTESYRACNRN